MYKMNHRNLFFLLVLSFFSMETTFAQADFRETLQSTLDSIIHPYEAMTGADFGPELTFSFKNSFDGVMRKEGSEYSGQLNSVKFVQGDSVRLEKVGLLGGVFAYANLGSDQDLAILGDEKIKELIELEDSLGFWNQFQKIEKVKVRDFAQYWMVLDCQEENYTMFEKVENVFLPIGNSTIHTNVINRDDRILLQFNFGTSRGKALLGLGCADTENQFVEFVFGDGTVLKSNNIEFDLCQTLEVDITDDLSSFENTITEFYFSMSKKDQRLKVDHEIPQNQINLKLDCLLDAK